MRGHDPFHRICANISGAMGETLPLSMVGGVGKVSLSLGTTLSFTHSVFVVDFCLHNVDFVSVTCLGGSSLGSNCIACHHHGAKRRLAVR